MTTFAIIIPTYNEEADVALALDSSLEQTVPADEVIIVDDGSNDSTVERLEQHPERERFVVIRHPRNRGLSAARNTGVDAATADVTVFLDADVAIPSDFLERLRDHYAAGAEFVAVESRTMNQTRAIGRYQQATHADAHGGFRNTGFTQAFSCLRSAAVELRFPEELQRLCGGEDGEFHRRLVAANRVGVQDGDIVVEHRLPDTLIDFFRQQRSRGRVTPFVDRYLKGYPPTMVAVRRLASIARTLLLVVAVVPGLSVAARRSRITGRPVRDYARFWALYHVATVAARVGEISGARQVLREAKSG